MPIFDFKNFNAKEFIPPSKNNNHSVYKGSFIGSDKVWFCKEVESYDDALLEVIAQEFFRLIIDYQPETCIAYDAEHDKYYVLSREVEGFNYKQNEFRKEMSQNLIKGLGLTLLVAVFLEEDDLKFNNLGKDKQNRTIKLDGGLCFSGSKRQYKLTAKLIESLPYPADIRPNHWLDLIRGGKGHSHSFVVSPELSNSIEFRSDVNQAMLKICSITDSFIELFVNLLISGSIEDKKYIKRKEYFIAKLINRRDELTKVALENPSFNAYLNLPETKQIRTDFIINMVTFSSGSQNLVFNPKQKDILFYEYIIRERYLLSYQARAFLEKIKSIVYSFDNSIEKANLLDLINKTEDLIAISYNFEPLMQKLEELLQTVLKKQQELKESEKSFIIEEKALSDQSTTIKDSSNHLFWQKSEQQDLQAEDCFLNPEPK